MYVRQRRIRCEMKVLSKVLVENEEIDDAVVILS